MRSMSYTHLIEEHPHLFSPGAFIDCGFGWQTIIDDMCLSLDFFIEEFDKEKYQDFKINSIISKFGVLNVDYDNSDPSLKKIIDFAIKLSYHTCEVCGKPGKIYCSNKWLLWSNYKILCKDHAIQYYYYEIRHPKGIK